MKKKFFCILLAIFLVVNLTFCNYRQVEAAALPVVPVAVETLIDILIGVGIAAGVIVVAENTPSYSLGDMTEAEYLQLYNTEQQYLQDMKFYMIDGSFGSTANCSVMTADGSILTLEEALNTATSMSLDDYMEMRKNSNNPTPSPGIDWGAIFIDGAVGGLMDFLESFLTSERVEKEGYEYPTTFYTGDSGYINRSTGEFNAFIEFDTLSNPYTKVTKGGGLEVLGGIDALKPNETNITHTTEHARAKYRVCLLIDDSDSNSWSSWIDHYYYDGNGRATGFSSSVLGYTNCVVLQTAGFSMSSDDDDLYCQKRSSVNYIAFLGSDYKDFSYFSTNIPVYDNYADAESYILGLSRPVGVEHEPYYADISNLCNSYKNKIVTLTTVESYGVTPTPTPSPTPRPTSTPTPSPTPSPTPFPTWSGTGPENFTTYNFYTEITNILNPIKTTINNVNQSITNIFNFFVIDTQEVSQEINNINVLPTSKFKDFVTTFGNLKNTFSNETQDALSEAGITNQYGISYPVIKVQCPKILLDYVPDNPSVVLYENDICYLILCDCSKFAKYFIKVRYFLKACIWFGMIFYLMRELKPIITLSD